MDQNSPLTDGDRPDSLATPAILFLLGAALTIAARLQRDTEGLV
ncbi:hypothetical protein [Microbacterium sp. NPDC055683]